MFEPSARVHVEADSCGRGKFHDFRVVGVAAEDDVGLPGADEFSGVVAYGGDFTAVGGVGGSAEAAAGVGDPPGEGHGPIGMNDAEEANGPTGAGDAAVNAISAVVRVDAVAVEETGAVLAKAALIGFAVDMKAEVTLEKGPRPEVVVSANKVKLESVVAKVGQGAENVEVSGKDDVPVFEPKIEEVADDNHPLEFPGIDFAKERDEVVERLTVRRVHFEVHIGEDEGLHRIKLILLGGQNRRTALPMTALSWIASKLRLSLLTTRLSPRT